MNASGTRAENNIFEIGGQNLLPDDCSSNKQSAIDEEVHPRIGALLNLDAVSVLLGAGASVHCGGPLIGSVPLSVERDLIRQGVRGEKCRVSQWLKVFYLAVQYSGSEVLPTREGVLKRHQHVLGDEDPEPIKVNFEQILALLYQWKAVLPDKDGRLIVHGIPKVNVNIKGKDIEKCLDRSSLALAHICLLPATDKKDCLRTHKNLVCKLLNRPLNLKRGNIFTLNYDTLIEQAADATGTVLIDGFVGTQNRFFRPESYEKDIYFPAETTEGKAHRFERVLHLYKLHGSITWTAEEPTLNNPYGIESGVFDENTKKRVLIYPTPAKSGDVLGLPYSELFRRFASTIVRPQSVLFVIGYSFGDEHVNTIIRQALSIPSFTLVVVNPNLPSENEDTFVSKLRRQEDRRVWFLGGTELGTFEGFVNYVLPDLQDEEIRKKVVDTQKALTSSKS